MGVKDSPAANVDLVRNANDCDAHIRYSYLLNLRRVCCSCCDFLPYSSSWGSASLSPDAILRSIAALEKSLAPECNSDVQGYSIQIVLHNSSRRSDITRARSVG